MPVVQNLAADLLGVPLWTLGPLLPAEWLYPLELGFLGLGWFGSLLVLSRLAGRKDGRISWRAFVPWATLLTLLFAVAIWLASLACLLPFVGFGALWLRGVLRQRSNG